MSLCKIHISKKEENKMRLNSEEFSKLVKGNIKADKIPKGTEFKVYDSNNKYMCTLAVQRTTITYLDVVKIPQDIFVGNYTFVEIAD